MLLNSSRTIEELGVAEFAHGARRYRFVTLPATELALKHVGRPVPNAALLGGFAAVGEGGAARVRRAGGSQLAAAGNLEARGADGEMERQADPRGRHLAAGRAAGRPRRDRLAALLRTGKRRLRGLAQLEQAGELGRRFDQESFERARDQLGPAPRGELQRRCAVPQVVQPSARQTRAAGDDRELAADVVRPVRPVGRRVACWFAGKHARARVR